MMSPTRRPDSVKSVMLIAVAMATIGLGPTVMYGQADPARYDPLYNQRKIEGEKRARERKKEEERKKAKEQQELLEREGREIQRRFVEPMERERKLMEEAADKEAAWQRSVHALSDFNYAQSIIDKVDHETALGFLRFWIDQGNEKAMITMGSAYEAGRLGLAKNRDEAIKYYTQAALKANGEAQYALGEIYSGGTPKNLGEASKWYLMAAKGGHAAALVKLQVLGDAGSVEAQYGLGGLYMNHKDGGPYARWFLRAAEQGHAEAQAWVGRSYQFGLGGVSKDSIVAEKWNRKAAEQGVLRAQLALAWMYHAGDGVAKNSPEAAKWYRKAAEQGDSTALNELAQLYQKGDGVPMEATRAVQLYRQAAEKGYAKAMYNLGSMYESGTDAPLDAAEAMRWYHKASEAGYPGVSYYVGCMYRTGRGVAKDPVEAVKWLRQAAEKDNNNDARIALGSMYENGEGVPQNTAEALKWYNLAAYDSADAKKRYLVLLTNGIADDLYKLAINYHYARDGTMDVAEAMKWYLKAAEQGHKDAAMSLGEIYYQGESVAKDPVEAMKWFRRAGEQKGQVNAQFLIGEIYYQGDGVTRDLVEAMKWFRLAASHGHPDAKFRLGNMYERGEGVAKNVSGAEEYYRAAFEYYDAPSYLAIQFIRGAAEEQGKIGGQILYQTMREASRTVRRVNKGMLASEFLIKAVQKGSTGAKLNLGYMYLEADGVRKDQAKGVRLIREAAEDGNPRAQVIIGDLYQKGNGVPQDLVEALAWYELARDSEEGQDSAAALEQKLGSQEVIQATQRRNELLATIKAKQAMGKGTGLK